MASQVNSIKHLEMQKKLSTKFSTVNYKLAFTKDIANN